MFSHRVPGSVSPSFLYIFLLVSLVLGCYAAFVGLVHVPVPMTAAELPSPTLGAVCRRLGTRVSSQQVADAADIDRAKQFELEYMSVDDLEKYTNL